MEGMEWGYNLAGTYVQPEIVYSSFTSSGGGILTTSGSFTSSAFLITLGRQMIMGESVTFDISGGIGYELYNESTAGETRVRYYSHSSFGSESAVAWKLSFTMGIMLR